VSFRFTVLAALIAVGSLGLVAGLTPGSSAAFIGKIANSTNTAATAPFFTCAGAVANDKSSALFTWPLNEASGATTAADTAAGSYPGAYQGTTTTSTTAPLACPRDTGGAYLLNGTTNYVTTAKSFVNPQTFSEEVWFKTTVAGGKLIGFGSSQTGASGSYDRHLYINTLGQLVFGTYNGAADVVTSTAKVNDGSWHQAVGTFSTAAGMSLYLDGSLVGSNAGYTVAQNFTGYWRVGYDSLSGWPSAGSLFFSGSMRFASVYTTVLSAAQVSQHYSSSR
jgi:hypothetical protein